MPKSGDQRSTRELLIEATLAEIVERGWGGVRGRNVAKRAGVNNALVHYHFGSMDDLRVAAAREAFNRLAESFSPDAMMPDVGDAIAHMAAQIQNAQLDDPIWQVLMEAFLQAPRDPRLAALASDLLGVYRSAVEGLVSTAISNGALPEGLDATGLAVAITAMLDGLGLHAYMDHTLDVARAGNAVTALLHAFTERKESR